MIRLSLAAAVLLLAASTPSAQSVALDPSFGSEGISTITPSTTSAARDLLLQPDGTTVLVGEIDRSAGAVRLLADGKLDATFGEGGTFHLPFQDRSSVLTDIERLPSGHLLVVGVVSNETRSSVAFSIVARLMPDGRLDPAFGEGGVVQIERGANARTISLAGVEVLASGQLLVAGSAVREATGAAVFVTARLLPNGALDTAYGSQGIARVDRSISVTDVLALDDGRLLLSGTEFVGDQDGDAVLLRLQTTGALDPEFGVDGVLTSTISDGADTFFQMALDSDDRIVTAGFAERPDTGVAEALVARAERDGTFDDSFGGSGLAKSAEPTRARGSAVALRPDGRILLVGLRGTQSRPLLAQFLPDGTPDASFGNNGVADLGDQENVVTLAISLDAEGRIVLAGYPLEGGAKSGMLAMRLVEASPIAAGQEPRAERAMLAHAGAHPSSSVALRLTLEAPGTLVVDVVDLLGRTVARLHDGPASAGSQTLTSGRGLPAGSYVVRAVTDDGRRATLPVVVIR